MERASFNPPSRLTRSLSASNTGRHRPQTTKRSYRKQRSIVKQRGMSLLEITFVLGIMGTISANVLTLAQQAYELKAVSEVILNISTLRFTMQQTWGVTGGYPAPDGFATKNLRSGDLYGHNAIKAPVGQLLMLGKVTPSEATNSLSGNLFNIGGVIIENSASPRENKTPVLRGYFVEIDGLTQRQCRNILLQVANYWDYVEVVDKGGKSDRYRIDKQALDLSKGDVINPDELQNKNLPISGIGIFRNTYKQGGNVSINPFNVLYACNDSASNGIILASR